MIPYLLIPLLAIGSPWLPKENELVQRRNIVRDFDFKDRIVPVIPEKGKKIRVIIDSDMKCEIDDQYAAALALLSPERFEILGFVASGFYGPHGGPTSIDRSYGETKLILEKMGLDQEIPVYKGSHPMQYMYTPSPSEGVDFIIEQAMASSKEDPVWIIAIGSATNLASAYLVEPDIRERSVFFWHGRTQWPEGAYNFNVFGDPIAARTLFDIPVTLVLFDTGGHLDLPMEESEKYVRPYGEIGKYLHDYRHTSAYFRRPGKGFFDLGDIAALLEPDIAKWEVVEAPEVEGNLKYSFTGRKGKILRCYDIDRDATFQLLYDKLKAKYGP